MSGIFYLMTVSPYDGRISTYGPFPADTHDPEDEAKKIQRHLPFHRIDKIDVLEHLTLSKPTVVRHPVLIRSE